MSAGAHIGVTNLYGLTAPAGGYAHQTSKSDKAEIVREKDDNGVTKYADPKPFIKSTVTMKGVGTPDWSLVVPVTGVSPGTLMITRAKLSETRYKRPQFEYTGVLYTNLT